MEGQASDLLVFGIENPLIDISLVVKDDVLLQKYELTMGSACLASEKQVPIYHELWATPGIEIIPGGSCLNSVRSANFMLKDAWPGKCAYFGCIGKDEYGQALEKELASTGVKGHFHHDEQTPTGTCAVIVKDLERSLCANLGACTKYPIEHLLTHIEIPKSAKVLYTTAFFITSNYEALIQVGKLAQETNKPLGFNLSAGFLIQFNTEQVNNALRYADYVFCNEDEAAVFAEVNKLDKDLKKLVIEIQRWPKENSQRKRVAVITQGKSPVLVATQNDADEVVVQEFEVPLIDKEKIVDLNGAGDAFVGGFLSQLALDKDLATCVKAGNYLAGQIIQRSGCTFPEKNEFTA